jgi:hypothetical protein
MANRRGVFCVLIFGLLTAGLSGCDQKLPSWSPFGSPAVNNHGIRTPIERVTILQELAAKAPQVTDPRQREAICQDLVMQLQNGGKGEPDSIIRTEIIKTLAVYGGPTADAVLRKAVQDPDADLRVIVCGLWGKRSDVAAAQVLADVLGSDGDIDVRMAAARALGHFRGPAVNQIVVQSLGTNLGDKDPAMRYCAMTALQESTGQNIGTAPEDVDRWKQYVKTGQPPPTSWAERVFPWYH